MIGALKAPWKISSRAISSLSMDETFLLVLVGFTGQSINRVLFFSFSFFLLDSQFIMKGYNSGTARCERFRGRVYGKEPGAPLPALSVRLAHLLVVTSQGAPERVHQTLQGAPIYRNSSPLRTKYTNTLKVYCMGFI